MRALIMQAFLIFLVLILKGKVNMDFTESVQRGDAFSALRMASVNGALWAIGSSWSTAIREIARVIVPSNTADVVVAEILAAGVVTFLGLGISLLVTRNCCAPFTYLSSLWRRRVAKEDAQKKMAEKALEEAHTSSMPPTNRVFVRNSQ